MNKLFSIILSGILILSTMLSTSVYAENHIPIDAFDQTDDSLEDWLKWIPIDINQRKTYHELLDDDFAGTLNDMFKHFDIGLVSGNEYDNLIGKYNFTTLTRIYYLDEIQETFNAVYNTKIDLSDLDGLNNDFIQIIDNYFCVTISPFKTFSMEIYPREGFELKNGKERWTWSPILEPHVSIEAVISHKNVKGYNLRCIDSMKIISSECSDIHQFKQVYTYNEVTYTANHLNTDFSINFCDGNVKAKKLPIKMGTDKMIYSFCICNGKIYYVCGSKNENAERAGIYVCDIDGNNSKLLTDKATNFSNCFLYNNDIYYDNRHVEYIHNGYSGIYKINVESGNIRKIVDDISAELGMVSTDEHLYYRAVKRLNITEDFMWNYSCNLYGTDKKEEAERDDRCDTLTGTYFVGSATTGLCYYYANGIIYESKLNSFDPVRAIANVDGDVEMLAADMWYVYYAKLDSPNAYVYKVPLYKDDTVKVCINNREIEFGEKYGQSPLIQDGRTIVPMRRIFEALGAEVLWDGKTQTITATHNNITIKLAINNNTMDINGKVVYLDVPAMLIGDTTGVPVRAVAEAFDAVVDWDQNTQTVTITN